MLQTTTRHRDWLPAGVVIAVVLLVAGLDAWRRETMIHHREEQTRELMVEMRSVCQALRCGPPHG